VTLPAPAQKIVSLAPSNTEILFYLGAGSQVIGRDEFSDFPAEAKSLPSVGGSMGKYNLEAIANLKPDLVLAANINTPEQVKALADLNLNVFYLANPADINGMYANLQIVAKLVGKEAQAETLIQSLKGRVDAVTAKLSKVTTKPRVYYELDFSNPAKPYTAGPGSFVDSLLVQAGGENIAAGLKGQYAEISVEEIVAKNPQVILLGDTAYSNPPVTPENTAQRPGWEALDAVKNKQVFAFDDNLVSRPTARLVDALEAIAKLVHPEAFK
jgi:iron complex transport system substrate-binding protein